MSEPLAIARSLFDRLEEAGIRHCQWKSNEHLAEGLAGLTDIDLLVDRAQAAQCERILASLSFKRFQSQPWARYPGIEDWIGFDEQTGRLVHIHLHYQLLTGAKHLKEQQLPWEQLVLDTAIKDPTYGVCIADPNIEMLLLVVRIGLKTTRMRIARARFGRTLVARDVLREFDYLMEQIDHDAVLWYARELLGVECSVEIEKILRQGSPSDPATLWRLKSAVGKALEDHRRYSRAAIPLHIAQRRLRSLAARAMRKLNITGQAGKRLNARGAVIAVLGSDGSGKSAVSSELQDWLAWKIDSHRVYFGTGDGPVIAPIKVAKRLARGTAHSKPPAPSATHERGNGKQRRSFTREIGSHVLGLAIAIDRQRKAVQAHRVSLNGGIIVADRYPQNQYHGIYDGPRTKDVGEQTSRIGRFLAQRELSIYNKIGELPPDIVLKLHVPVEVARLRKPDHSVDEILRKSLITNALEFPSSRVIDIDASAPLDCVLLTAKKRVWDSL